MTGNIAETCDAEKYEHLAGIPLPDGDSASVQLIIGQDHSDAFMPLEVKHGEKGEPLAI